MKCAMGLFETDPALFKETYWNRPEPRQKGDPDVNMIYHAVGNALSWWEIAEGELAQLFCFVTRATTDATSYRAVYRAFGAIHTNAGRRDVITAAAEVHFSPYWQNKTVRKSLTQVLDAVRHGSKLRDDIAHGMVASYVVQHEDFGAFLTPPEYNQSRTHAEFQGGEPLDLLRTRYRYTSADIMDIAAKFQKLHLAIGSYSLKVICHEGRIPIVEEILRAEQAAKNRK
jgi:hypothetical protein